MQKLEPLSSTGRQDVRNPSPTASSEQRAPAGWMRLWVCQGVFEECLHAYNSHSALTGPKAATAACPWRPASASPLVRSVHGCPALIFELLRPRAGLQVLCWLGKVFQRCLVLCRRRWNEGHYQHLSMCPQSCPTTGASQPRHALLDHSATSPCRQGGRGGEDTQNIDRHSPLI
jgi:hypothetical protein